MKLGARFLDEFYSVILGKTGDDTYQVPSIDSVARSLIGIQFGHHEIHDGDTFDQWHTLTGKNDGTYLTIYFRSPYTGGKRVHMLAKWESSGAAYFRIREYPVVTVNTGTTKAVYNCERDSENTSLVFDNATIPVRGACMTDVTIANRTPATRGVNGGLVIFEEYSGVGKTAGGGSRSENERVLAADMPYVFEVESDAAALVLALQLVWYEHSPKGI